jgi:hypothetical protein
MSVRAVAATLALSVALVPGALLASGVLSAAPAQASTCSTTLGVSSCSVSASLTITQGTVQLFASTSLSWSYILDGYDQWASGSASSLSNCLGSVSGTTCSGGSLPLLEVDDSSGTGDGWAVSAYLSSSDLPTGSVLTFDGTGTATVGDSVNSPVSIDPFSPTTPTSECDYHANGCNVAVPATTCSHSAIGFMSCPIYPVLLPATSSATSQVDLYSARASSGEGAVCFATGSPTGTGCAGATPDDYFNLGIPSSTAAASDLSTVINLTASSGP